MKTTVKLSETQKIIVGPSMMKGHIILETKDTILSLTPDQAGALIFGLEQALETSQIQASR